MIVIVIPAYNEAKVIANVIKRIKKEGYDNIVVVNDCSKDNTAHVAKKAGAMVLSHPINRGAGATTKTGLDFAKEQGATHVVTIDADGQHDPGEIKDLLAKANDYNVVIGSRMINPQGMPFSRWLVNYIGSFITYILYGVYVRDSQSGFKVFDKKALESIEIKFDRYEFCSEVIHELRKKKLTYTEVPIKAIYTAYSLSKGQFVFNGFRMVYKMIMRFFI